MKGIETTPTKNKQQILKSPTPIKQYVKKCQHLYSSTESHIKNFYNSTLIDAADDNSTPTSCDNNHNRMKNFSEYLQRDIEQCSKFDLDINARKISLNLTPTRKTSLHFMIPNFSTERPQNPQSKDENFLSNSQQQNIIELNEEYEFLFSSLECGLMGNSDEYEFIYTPTNQDVNQ